jgi:uridine phosphorylase
MSHGPLHLRPTAPLGEHVLLPGDPGRALALAQALLLEPRMFNHHRGLWGYTGEAPDGRAVTIQATGMGGPSAAIVLTELIELGATAAVRVGTCGALVPELGLGQLVIASEALCQDGTSRALGAGEKVTASGELTAALALHAPQARVATVASVDLFYEPEPAPERPGAQAIEMEAASLFTVGAAAGIPVACLLTVSDTFDGDDRRERIDDERLLDAAEQMGQAALAALGHGRAK